LSHSTKNNAEAIAVRDWMIAKGWDDIFLDLDPGRGLKAGERWQDALRRAAERCELVIILISPGWASSKWCLAEFLLAKSLSKRIFAVIVEPTPFKSLPFEMTSEWQVIDLTAGNRDYLATVTLPPGDRKATVALAKEGLSRLQIGLLLAGVEAKHFAWPPANDPSRSPYRGLKPFEADDAGIFFGRDAPIVGALDRLRRLRDAAPPRLFVILGASGAGKSSFLRAGLFPRLVRDHRNFVPLPVVRPERAALFGDTGLLPSLVAAFDTAGIPVPRANIRAAIKDGAAKLAPLLQSLVDKVVTASAEANAAPAILALSIDQAEELFQPEAEDEARGLLALVRELAIADAPAILVVFTIRSDNYHLLQGAKELESLLKVPFDLGPMPKGSYAEIINGPARRLQGEPRRLKIEPGLVDELLADVETGGAKDALPLLAFTLERLYADYHAGGALTLDHYNQLGRVKGSIEAAISRVANTSDAANTHFMAA
jgi:hypothetical protein